MVPIAATEVALAWAQGATTLVLAVITGFYAWRTHDISRAARDQADASQAQTATAKIQAHASQAQAEAAKIQAETARLEMLHTVFVFMEKSRPSRAALREYIYAQRKLERNIDGAALPEAIANAADEVCRSFDFLGLLDRHHWVDESFVDEFYAAPLVLLYDDLLGDFVKSKRDEGDRGMTHFWEFTELYNRVRCVPQNHPALHNLKEWPANPRECS